MDYRSKIRTGSDFSGVGAFDQALLRLGIEQDKVFACDIDRYARQTYIENYGEPEYFPEDVYEREVPEEPLDLYMTSPPCQSFSVAGSRLGEEDRRGILFYNSHEFISKNKPRFFIFENVRGLTSHDTGRTFRRWLDYLGGKSVNGNPVIFPHEESVPYHIYWRSLNATEFNVPQNRDRIFIVGIRDDKDNVFSWPKKIHLTKKLKDVLEPEVDPKYILSEKLVKWIIKHRHKRDSGDNFPSDENRESMCITSRYFKCGAEDPYVEVKSDFIADFRNDEGLRIRDNELSPCITHRRHSETDPSTMPPLLGRERKVRRLTPRECFRLMDFPDTFTWTCSDTQAYKQAGNSIVVSCLAGIIEKLRL